MRRLFALVLALAAGCASPPRSIDAPFEEVRACRQWYEALDRVVDESGVRDAQASPVAGFPYLRVDRPLAALRERAAHEPGALRAFADRLAGLDHAARRHEIMNLPATALERLAGAGASREAVLQRTAGCSRLLRERDAANAEAGTALLEAARVPDDYSLAMRVLGLYPITRLAFAGGVRRWERQTLETFAAPAPRSNAVRYAPPPGAPLPRALVRRVLARAEADPLGVPALSAGELDALAAAYAPSFDIAVEGDFDRFGELRWVDAADVPQVDASQPVVYVLPAHTLYHGRMLLQLVYTIWFPERPRQGSLDLLGGRLDGIVWRVTLAPDGEPVLYDSIHPCGCYHEFFPTSRARPLPPPDPLEEWAFVPQRLPRVADGERPVVRVASGTHYVEQVTFVRGIDSLTRYELRPYDELRSLPQPQGGRRSAFGPDGLIRGSERAERFLFWPMGIASAGAMRQWGRHATAFVGRRHFDDADLLERRFDLDLGGTDAP